VSKRAFGSHERVSEWESPQRPRVYNTSLAFYFFLFSQTHIHIHIRIQIHIYISHKTPRLLTKALAAKPSTSTPPTMATEPSIQEPTLQQLTAETLSSTLPSKHAILPSVIKGVEDWRKAYNYLVPKVIASQSKLPSSDEWKHIDRLFRILGIYFMTWGVNINETLQNSETTKEDREAMTRMQHICKPYMNTVSEAVWAVRRRGPKHWYKSSKVYGHSPG
jgi:hypothetical protein